jgi:hypothetical protein
LNGGGQPPPDINAGNRVTRQVIADAPLAEAATSSEAAMQLKPILSQGQEITIVNICDVSVTPNRIRPPNEVNVEKLAKSMAEVGMIEPAEKAPVTSSCPVFTVLPLQKNSAGNISIL